MAGSSGSADGIGNSARFDYPSGIAVDNSGNLYVSDTYNNTIRKLKLVGTNWVVTTLGGMPGFYGTADGTESTARFSNPSGLAVDGAGNLYVADYYFNTIRKGYPPTRLVNVGLFEGDFRFGFTGPPGQTVIVQASSDLVSWSPILTNSIGPDLVFRRPLADVISNGFFRVRVPSSLFEN